ncbi:MAG: type II toxin-antitoxin system RelE/ParE family toxin [Campylobacterales bacterium]|nr:type II toxin-antitoxin system RelE/ParE family toxin [Campylobacterales bacterium]
MSYEIKPLKPFEKFYAKRNEKEKAVIKSKFELLKNDPYDSNSLDIKKLKGFTNRYRLRVWDYRIIYEIYDEVLIIIAIDGDNRGDVYK